MPVEAKDPTQETEDNPFVPEKNDEEPQAEERTLSDVVEEIQPKAEPKEWHIQELEVVGQNGDGEVEYEVKREAVYVQKPLSYFTKIEFFALLGDTIDRAMSGPEGLTVNSMLDALPGSAVQDGRFNADALDDIDSFVRALAKLARYSESFIQDCYAIWLGVPYEQRPWFKYAISRPKDLGGFDDDDGLEVIERFLDQNGEAIKAFFKEKLPKVLRRGQARMTSSTETKKKISGSASSKPSKRIRRPTGNA